MRQPHQPQGLPCHGDHPESPSRDEIPGQVGASPEARTKRMIAVSPWTMGTASLGWTVEGVVFLEKKTDPILGLVDRFYCGFLECQCSSGPFFVSLGGRKTACPEDGRSVLRCDHLHSQLAYRPSAVQTWLWQWGKPQVSHGLSSGKLT